jgi:hypothetical protein
MTNAGSTTARLRFDFSVPTMIVALLDNSVRAVFENQGFNLQYGPADRYGIIEWGANVPHFEKYLPDLELITERVDITRIALNLALAAWRPDGDSYADTYAEAQITVGVRSDKFFTRWHFAPITLHNLEDSETSRDVLVREVTDAYTSKRTLAAIQSVVSPEDAPSGMTVHPVLEGTPLLSY